jgi:hypothetical protein
LGEDAAAEIERLRRERLSGPAIARQARRPVSTVGAWLRRLGLGRLSTLDPKPPVIHYEREKPGELIHIDTKKLGRIDGIGRRFTGYHTGMVRNGGIGCRRLSWLARSSSGEKMPRSNSSIGCPEPNRVGKSSWVRAPRPSETRSACPQATICSALSLSCSEPFAITGRPE